MLMNDDLSGEEVYSDEEALLVEGTEYDTVIIKTDIGVSAGPNGPKGNALAGG